MTKKPWDDLPADLKQALEEGDPIAEQFVQRLIDQRLDQAVDQQLEDDWDDAARAHDYSEPSEKCCVPLFQSTPVGEC